MTTAIQVQSRSPDTVQAGSPGHLSQFETYFTEAQEQMILKTFLGGATKEEAIVLLETVRRRRLDPFSRQVYFVKRYDMQKREEVWAIQTSIDGLRSIADRTGHYEGQTKPEWCGPDGVWRDVWLGKDAPAAARVGVYKTGFREPAYGVARHDAYVQTKKDGSITSFWRKMPDLMLAKCAEALAIRKAFPEDTGGLYVAEEMGQEKDEGLAAEPKKIEAPRPVVEVLPPPPPVAKPAAKPAHVVHAWETAKRIYGDAKRSAEPWKVAVQTIIGNRPSDSMTEAEALDIEAILSEAQNPQDVNY